MAEVTPTEEKNSSRWKDISSEDLKSFALTCLLDIYVFLFAFGCAITNITAMQIIQDKVCINDLKLPEEICLNIEKRPEYSREANRLYTTATTFRMYEDIIIFVPSILITLFIGKLLDKYPQHLKFFFAAPLIGVTLHCFTVIYNVIYFELDYRYLYLAKIPFGIFGSIALFYSASYTYVLRYTPVKFREVRFGMIDFAFNMGLTLSMACGGSLLVSKSWFYPRLRNYMAVYSVSALACTLALIWMAVVIRNSNLRKHISDDEKNGEERTKDSGTSEQTCITNPTSQSRDTGENSRFSPLDNMIQMARTCAKKRPNNGHIRLWWCLACVCLSQICLMGELTVVYQFVQKVYGWDAQYFSNLKTITNLIPTFGAIAFPVILVNKMKLSDTTLGIIGSYSLIFSCLIKGGFLVPAAFYLGEVVSMFTEMMSIAFRTIAARLISSDEYGQVFTVLSCIQASSPVTSSILYTLIFNNTLDWYPGFVYHTVASMMFMPYIVLVWMDLSERRRLAKSS